MPLRRNFMQKWTNTISFNPDNDILKRFFTEDTLFFDIETTGFSSTATHIYLIGCARRCGNTIMIEQFFADSPEDEDDILRCFLELLEPFQTLITFNGMGFDIPYIKAKCDAYSLKETLSNKNNIDLFKIASSLKFLLKLPNYKQKTIEHFLGIHREDVYDGGQLIPIYKEYVHHPSKEQMYFLKQHNYEDVLGMPDLLPLLSYSHFFDGGYTITSVKSNIFTDYDGIAQKELIFSLTSDISVPKQVSYGYDAFYLICNGREAKLSVRLYEGSLKYFFENYKDYFYLPEEDTAIHKDIAASVDKAYKKRATVSTCYIKKASIFLPQYEKIMEPAFYKERKDKISYFELSDEFIDCSQILFKYIDHILRLMKKQKH